MIINDIMFNAELEDILTELVSQLRMNDIQYIQKMQATSKTVQVCCPYHKGGMERRPSAGIRKSDGAFHCFACGEIHSLQEVISYCFGYPDDLVGSFGWKWLLKNFATIEVEERKDVELDLERDKDYRQHRGVSNSNPDGSISLDDTDNRDKKYVGRDELDKYRYYHPYWTKRGITDEHIIELFDLGYDPETKCITFPVRDQKGNCLFIARRSVHTKYFSYPTGVEKPLYGIYELYHWGEYNVAMNVGSIGDLIICESMIDALTAWQYGKFAIALNGTGTSEQFKELRRIPCRHLILATDMDPAGLDARVKIRQNIPNKLITEYIWDREMAKDLNDMTKEQFDSLEEFF